MIVDEKSAMFKTTAILAGSTIYGLTLEWWVGILTLVFLLLQIGILLPRYVEVFERWYDAIREKWRSRGSQK
jgi:uncharacterized membrane protein